ncbi:MAG: PD-(D/E)XK motif protein [Planctomycetes bacterium]|nr:PD-(D/E)XK motif protein [Planctomycetota bacterium]
MRLAQLFESLPAAAADGELPSFSTLVIGAGPHRLGKDTSGAPALLVSLPAAPGGNVMPPPVELEHISVRHGVRCRLWRASAEPEAATVSLVHCREAERVLRDYFLSVVEGVLPLLGPAPTEARVRDVVAALIELFRALELPPRKPIQGLWGELCVIVQATNTVALLEAWHASPEEPYDFTRESQRLEVKTASGDERRHHFTLAQLHPPAGASAVIASLFAERAGGGVSLGELLDRARLRVSTRGDLAVRLERVVAATLGQSWRRGLSERFDWERAQESLAFFDAAAVPSVLPTDVPSGVTDVGFRSTLEMAHPLGEAAMRERGGLLQAAVPFRAARR